MRDHCLEEINNGVFIDTISSGRRQRIVISDKSFILMELQFSLTRSPNFSPSSLRSSSTYLFEVLTPLHWTPKIYLSFLFMSLRKQFDSIIMHSVRRWGSIQEPFATVNDLHHFFHYPMDEIRIIISNDGSYRFVEGGNLLFPW